MRDAGNLMGRGDTMVAEETGSVPSASSVMAGADRAPSPPLPPRAQRALSFGLLVSALRCTVQYVVLPFVLPWIGVSMTISPWITLVLGAIALGSLARNVRALWRVRHPRRWSYLLLALVVAAALLIFTAVDLRALLRA